eukprot:97558_1
MADYQFTKSGPGNTSRTSFKIKSSPNPNVKIQLKTIPAERQLSETQASGNKSVNKSENGKIIKIDENTPNPQCLKRNISELLNINLLEQAIPFPHKRSIFISIAQLNSVIKNKWTKTDSQILSVWCRNNQTTLVFMSFLCGSSFAAVKLARSNLFGLRFFSMPLNLINFMSFMTGMIYSINLLENLPQISIQIIYIYITSKEELTDPMVYLSMLFSVISVIGGIFAMCAQKNILEVEQYTQIKYDVIGKSVQDANKNLVNALRHKIAALLRVDYSLVDIMRPLPVRNGVEITINVMVKNNRSYSMDFGTKMKEVQQSGELAEYMVELWSLLSTPNITNLSCQLIQSYMEQNLIQQVRASVTKR